jgi:hypothetical protein
MSFASLRLVGLGTAVFLAGFAAAQTGTPKAGPAEKPQKLAKVATLNTVEANREFQANVQLVQAQRQAAIELNAAHDKETNPAKKKELKSQLDTLLARLNENNSQMRKTYGFSLDRNYTLVIETAHVYMFVSDEEAAKIEKAEAARKKK